MKKHTRFLELFSGLSIILTLLGIGCSASIFLTAENVVSAAVPASSIYDDPPLDVLVIPSAAFRNDGINPNVAYFYSGGGYWRGGGVLTCLMAPVYLPRIATIKQMWATVYDNDTYYDLGLSLFRVDNFNGDVITMAQLSTSGASTALLSLNDMSVQQGLVNYPQYSYYLGTCLGSSLNRLYNVRIWYSSYKIYLPLIAK